MSPVSPVGLVSVLLLVIYVIYLGVALIRGKLGHTPKKDQARVDRWQRAQKRGFLLHSAITQFPFILGYCLLGPYLKHWKATGSTAYPTDDLGYYFIFGVLLTLIGGFFSWGITKSGAREAQERLAANQYS